MFIRPCYRRKNGKRRAYWALVESYRTARGPPQRVVAYLGQADGSHREGVKRAAGGGQTGHQQALFDEDEPDWVQIDSKRVRVERCRDFGGPWLGWQLLGQTSLPGLLAKLLPAGREDIAWSRMALVLVLWRLCEPSSELRIAEHIYKHSALGELLGVPAGKVNDDRLYRALDALLPHKAALERAATCCEATSATGAPRNSGRRTSS